MAAAIAFGWRCIGRISYKFGLDSPYILQVSTVLYLCLMHRPDTFRWMISSLMAADNVLSEAHTHASAIAAAETCHFSFPGPISVFSLRAQYKSNDKRRFRAKGFQSISIKTPYNGYVRNVWSISLKANTVNFGHSMPLIYQYVSLANGTHNRACVQEWFIISYQYAARTYNVLSKTFTIIRDLRSFHFKFEYVYNAVWCRSLWAFCKRVQTNNLIDSYN